MGSAPYPVKPLTTNPVMESHSFVGIRLSSFIRPKNNCNLHSSTLKPPVFLPRAETPEKRLRYFLLGRNRGSQAIGILSNIPRICSFLQNSTEDRRLLSVHRSVISKAATSYATTSICIDWSASVSGARTKNTYQTGIDAANIVRCLLFVPDCCTPCVLWRVPIEHKFADLMKVVR